MKTKYFLLPECEELNEKLRPLFWVWRPKVLVLENIYFRMFGMDYMIPKWFVSDGNSFPFFMQAFKSSYDIRWLFAWLVHDYIYATQFLPRIIADLIYYYILRDTAGKFEAYKFYKWVRIWGWKAWRDNWKNPKEFPRAKHDLRKYLLSK